MVNGLVSCNNWETHVITNYQRGSMTYDSTQSNSLRISVPPGGQSGTSGGSEWDPGGSEWGQGVIEWGLEGQNGAQEGGPSRVQGVRVWP